MKNTIDTIAIIGLGAWGMRVLRSFYSLETVGNITVFDLDSNKIEAAKNVFPKITGATSVESIMRSDAVKAVAIVTAPLATHYQLGKLALSFGKHLWLEKPLAASLQEARELVMIARRKKLQLHVDRTFVYSAPVRFIKEVLATGGLGKPHSISMKRCNIEKPGVCHDVFWDLAYHDFSILSFWFGTLPDLADVQRDSVSDGIVGHGRIALRYASGPDVTIEVGRVGAEKIRSITIAGRDRTLVYEDLDEINPVKMYDANGQPISTPPLQIREPLLIQAEQFVECIVKNEQSETDGEADLEIIKLLEQVSGPR